MLVSWSWYSWKINIGSLPNYFLICISRRIIGRVIRSLTLITETEIYDLSINPETWDSVKTSNPLNKGKSWSPWGKIPVHYQKYILFIFNLSFPQKDLQPFPRVTMHWGKWNNQTYRKLIDTSSELIIISGDSKHHCGPPLKLFVPVR